LEDLRKLIAHGALAPSFLAALAGQYPSIDGVGLSNNLRGSGVSAIDVLRALAQSSYHPRDLLLSISGLRGDPKELLLSIVRGTGLGIAMNNLGFKQSERRQSDGA
jgi:hypothetical protein